ncbi:aminotransferase class V-fold PLP-dependent enzyme [Candidatus Latescibacterota bacterium]
MDSFFPETREIMSSVYISRRDILIGSGLAALAGTAGCAGLTTLGSQKPGITIPTYESIGVKPIINCWGAVTVLSGSLMLPEVKMAMEEAGRHYVAMEELIEAVGIRMAELTGAEWGCVTSGAAAAIFAAAAACVAGADPRKILKLPDTAGMKNEAVVSRAHNNIYNISTCKMVGITLHEVDSKEDMEAAINDKTAIMFILGENSAPNHPSGGNISLEDMIAIGKKYGVPMLVDAAAERPDVPNFYLEAGADMVCYSGGKHLRGPQCTGILLGRRDLVFAASRNISPFNGMGRPMKVGKEEIIGVLAALDLWINGRDHDAEWREWERKLTYIRDRINTIPAVKAKIIPPGRRSNVEPTLSIDWDENTVKISRAELRQQLLDGEPRIAIALTRGDPLRSPGSAIRPDMMEDGDEIPVARRLYEVLSGAL